MAEAQWHVGVGGERKGPFTEDDVKGMIQRGELTARDMVWTQGMENWVPVSEVPAFTKALQSAPPPPPPAVAAPSPFVESLKGFWSDFARLVVNPGDGLGEVADRKPLCASCIWIGLGVVIFALLKLLLFKRPLIIGALGGVHVFDMQVEGGGREFLFGLLQAVIVYGVWFGMLMLVLKPILRSPAGWQEALAILGLTTIPVACVGLVVFALGWATAYFYVLFAFAAPVALYWLYQLFVHTSKASHRVALYVVPAFCIVGFVVNALLEYAFRR